MADIMLATSTYQTGTNDTASTLLNNVSSTDAQQPNGIASAAIQIETILGAGTTLKGSAADLAARLAVSLTASGALVLDDYLFETGDIVASFRVSKVGWLLMDGSNRSNTLYEALLDQVISFLSTVSTHTLRVGTAVGTPTADASTDTFTLASHGLSNNAPIYFTNSGGALPSGVSALTKYYVIGATTNTFQISTTVGGAAVNFTTNGTGTHSVYNSFICDGRGRSVLGADNMGGVSANRATDTAADNVGQAGGSDSGITTHTHVLTDPGHAHQEQHDGGLAYASSAGASSLATIQAGPFVTTTPTPLNTTTVFTGITLGSVGTGTGNMHPYFTVNYFIKT